MNVRTVVPRDAIPSVDDPTFRETHADPDARVIAIERSDHARAYPLAYLDYHEIVNDRVGDIPIAVTWCPLCGSAVVYDRQIDDRTLTFGVSGKLADDALIMYDRETDTEWKQSSGAAIAGPLTNHELTALPATVTTWARFRARHPDGVVLAPPGGDSEAASDTADPVPIDYDTRPYAGYHDGDGFGLEAHRGTLPTERSDERAWHREDIDPKTVVLGITADDDAVAFTRPAVEAAGGVVNATVGSVPVVVTATHDGLHAFERGDSLFDANATGMRADGTTWNPATGRSVDGRQLPRVAARRLYAFAWRDDHGGNAFWTNG